jgi:hypothetical protein
MPGTLTRATQVIFTQKLACCKLSQVLEIYVFNALYSMSIAVERREIDVDSCWNKRAVLSVNSKTKDCSKD